jgi:hypothetical protein
LDSPAQVLRVLGIQVKAIKSRYRSRMEARGAIARTQKRVPRAKQFF